MLVTGLADDRTARAADALRRADGVVPLAPVDDGPAARADRPEALGPVDRGRDRVRGARLTTGAGAGGCGGTA